MSRIHLSSLSGHATHSKLLAKSPGECSPALGAEHTLTPWARTSALHCCPCAEMYVKANPPGADTFPRPQCSNTQTYSLSLQGVIAITK